MSDPGERPEHNDVSLSTGSDLPASGTPSNEPTVSVWSRVPFWVKVAVPAGLIIVAAIAVVVVLNSQPSQFESAITDCELDDNSFARIGDDGRSLILDTKGEGESGLRVEDLACVLLALDASDVVVEQMSSTRALDGRQSGQWGDIAATWSYHPDAGLDVILESK